MSSILHLDVAAVALAEQLGRNEFFAMSLLAEMNRAAAAGRLTVRNRATGLRLEPIFAARGYGVVGPAEVNEWLERDGAPFRWSSTDAKPTSRVINQMPPKRSNDLTPVIRALVREVGPDVGWRDAWKLLVERARNNPAAPLLGYVHGKGVEYETLDRQLKVLKASDFAGRYRRAINAPPAADSG